jgi:single-stranded-DNA-specific exonuclease
VPSFPSHASPHARDLARSLGTSLTFADILDRRGFCDDDSTRKFLDPKLSQLTSPQAMAGRAQAIDRIARAVRARERVLVYGDYDCDGITSTALLTEVIETLGGDVRPMLADRFSGGYGLSDRSADNVIEQRPGLLVTCDCGSSDHERLQKLATAGIDVIVIDHHLVPPQPLPVLAFLNPNRADCGYGYKHLASVGLALTVAAGLRSALQSSLDVRRWLDLVAIGTVADVAALDGDNRVLVRAGMRSLQSSPRPGLRWLAEQAHIQLSAGVSAETISFDIGPRLNAPGRLGSPMPALQLLLARDDATARELSARVEAMRQQRRQIQDRIVSEALAEIEQCGFDRDPAIVLGRTDWHQGVLGIVAAQLVGRFRVPVVVVGFDAQGGRGSARGPEGVPVFDLLTACRHAPVSFGGHQAAAGVHLDPCALPRFRELFNEAAAKQARASADRGDQKMDEASAEARLADEDLVADVVRDMARLEPCGTANPVATLAIVGAKVQRARSVRGGHLQLRIALDRGQVVSGFGLSMGERAVELARAARVDAIGTLRRDDFRGGDAVGMRIRWVQPATG